MPLDLKAESNLPATYSTLLVLLCYCTASNRGTLYTLPYQVLCSLDNHFFNLAAASRCRLTSGMRCCATQTAERMLCCK